MNFASLPWYDLPELRSLTDRLWMGIAEAMRAEGISGVPKELARGTNVERTLGSKTLLFSQACGYDVVNDFRKYLRLVATPHYSAEGCSPGRYRSFVVVRKDSPARRPEDLRGLSCAVNGTNSHSGMNALRALIAPFSRRGRFFSEIRISGGHAASLEMVSSGRADVAAIDCITHALIARCRPHLVASTRVLLRTDEAPAPPFVTRAATDDATLARMRRALEKFFSDPKLSQTRRGLLLTGFSALPLSAYGSITRLEDAARRRGYTEFERRFELEARR